MLGIDVESGDAERGAEIEKVAATCDFCSAEVVLHGDNFNDTRQASDDG